MITGKRLICKTSKQAAQSAELTALQKNIEKNLSENIASIQEFMADELPKIVNSQKNAMEGLEQLANYVKGMIK